MTSSAVRTVLTVHAAALVAMGLGLYLAGMTVDEARDSAWAVPFLVINVGVLLGNGAMYWLLRQPDAAGRLALEGRREDLEDSRQVVVEQLKALEAERDKLSSEDYARERAELLAIGTEALRALDDEPHLGPATVVREGRPPFELADGGFPTAGGAATSPATSPPTLGPIDALAMRMEAERRADPVAFDAALARLGMPTGSGGMSGEWKGALYTLGVVALVGVMYTMAAGGARDRAPGMTMTGGDQTMPSGPAVEGGAPAPPMQTDPRIAELQNRLVADPTDLDAMNQVTELSILAKDFRTAMDMNTRALTQAPDDADAHVFHALLRAVIGQRDEAFAELDQVIEGHPTNVLALVYRGILSVDDDPARAVEVLERASQLDDSPQVTELLARARAAASGAPMASMRPSPGMAAPPGDAPPADGQAEVLVAGTIELADSAAASGQKLFVSIRAPSGPPMPLAALNLAPGPFPMPFVVTSANQVAMAGMARPVPPTFTVVARLDSDGDPMTRPPTDPSITLEGVTRGTTGLTLKLQ
ncbi:MAG: hypothetical protein H6733_14765 [Alphaproteobacteria bacterium]|nr:hypothetical protein [Alphaproteobacteria bacterium]